MPSPVDNLIRIHASGIIYRGNVYYGAKPWAVLTVFELGVQLRPKYWCAGKWLPDSRMAEMLLV
jgi:hypothetical protein